MTKELAKFNNAVLKALSGIYVFMHLVDLKTHEQYTLSDEAGIGSLLDETTPIQEQIEKVVRTFCISDDMEELLKFTRLDTVIERLHNRKSISMEFRGKNLGWCRTRFIAAEKDELGQATKIIFTVLLIDEEKRRMEQYRDDLERALSNQNEIYSEMLQMQGGGFIAAGSMNGQILTINDSALELLGLEKNHPPIKTVADLANYAEVTISDEVKQELRRIEKEGGNLTYEMTLKTINGLRYVQANTKQITTHNGNVFIITTLSDITSNKEQEQALRLLSDTDVLTGINNRGSGERQIKDLLESNIQGMFCLLDIDKFKEINDTYGHLVGDEVLIKLANTLKGTLRQRDLLWRLGGDEFAFYAVGVDGAANGAECLRRIFQNISRMDIPALEGKEVTISVGAVFVKEKYSFEGLYKLADEKLYLSKKACGNHYEF